MHSKKIEDVAKELKSDLKNGLNDEEAKIRIEKYGENKLTEGKQKGFFALFAEQFKSVLIGILIAAAIISALMGEVTEGLVILVIVLINSFIGAKQEKSAGDAVNALRSMASPRVKVLRGGTVKEIDSKTVVLGDIVLLESGNYVPADMRLIETVNFKVEESALTGESLPVEKDYKSVTKQDTPLSERINMAYMGTVASYGRATGIVTGTGMNTEMGKIAGMLDTEDDITPLQRKLEKLGSSLGYACMIVCAGVFVLGLVRKMKIMEVFMTAVSLAVAAVPEGLPAIVTVILAIGMQRMVKRNVLTKNLSSVETLGSTTVICSDKTGTLTQNKMNVKRVFDGFRELDVTGEGYSTEGTIGAGQDITLVSKMLMAAVLCNDANLTDEGGVIGDPTEGALLTLGAKGGFVQEHLKNQYPRLKEYPFDSVRKMMSTLHKIEGKLIMLTKGAPDVVLHRCTQMLTEDGTTDIDAHIKEIFAVNDHWSQDALRVLAFAYKEIKDENSDIEAEEHDMIFTGLTGMIDPPRPEVKDAIEECRSAGIRVVMITGDNAVTASAIGRQIGLLSGETAAVNGSEIDRMSEVEFAERVKSVNVFSRVSPEHKVRIVDALKVNGDILAMTGDGVNDAPSLKKADIGIAMGITGTDVSKEAADMILTDDNFTSIVGAVEEGRVIYSNIRKFVAFLISCNVGEIIMIATSMIIGWGVPLMPIQLLFVNLITDSLPAFALGMEGMESDVMNHAPRDPKENIVDSKMKKAVVFQSIALAAASLISYRIGMRHGEAYAVTYAFITLICGELLRAYSGRSEDKSVFSIGFFGNKYLNIATIVSALITAVLFIWAPLRSIFSLLLPNIGQILTAVVLAVIPFAAGEISKLIK